MDFPIPSGYLLADRDRKNPWKDYLIDKFKTQEDLTMKDEYERSRKKHENMITEEFYEPKDRIPSNTANSEYKYKQMMK